MDVQRKTIQTLTVDLDKKREELSQFYHQFGEKLLGDSSDPTIIAGALSIERIENWRSLMSSREIEARSILDIKAAVTRQQELVLFRKELEKNLTEEKGQYKENLEELGRTFYGQYTPKDEAFFGETYQKASAEGNVLISLEEKHEKMQEELIESGFFGKMFVQFKMVGLASNIRNHKTRLMEIMHDGAASLLSGGILEDRLSEGSLGSELIEIFSSVKKTGAHLDELLKRAQTIESDLSFVKDSLETLGASDNPSRRMEELRSHVKETDKRINSLTILCAREYSDKFLDEEGISLLGNTGDGHTFSDMGVYGHQLEQVALHRSGITIIRRKIEILETSVKIDSLEKSIVVSERSIEEHEKKIAYYQESAEKLRNSIREASEEKIRLCEHKEAIEKKLNAF